MFEIIIAVHISAAAALAIHVINGHRRAVWLAVLFLLPVVGSLAYLAIVFLPEMIFEFRVRRLAARENSERVQTPPAPPIEHAQDAFDQVPSLEHRLRLAEAMLDAGRADVAVEHYRICLAGVFADQPDIRLGAARAFLLAGQATQASEQLQALRTDTPTYRAEDVALLLAQAFDLDGRSEEAKREFAAAADRYRTVATRTAYAMWALKAGDLATAVSLREAMEADTRGIAGTRGH